MRAPRTDGTDYTYSVAPRPLPLSRVPRMTQARDSDLINVALPQFDHGRLLRPQAHLCLASPF